MAYRPAAHTRVLLLSAAALLAVATTPAHAADQFKQGADGALMAQLCQKKLRRMIKGSF